MEGCISRSGWPHDYEFHTVENFINDPTQPGSDMITIPDFIAAPALHRSRRTGDAKLCLQAQDLLKEAVDHWDCYAQQATRQHAPQILARNGLIDLAAIERYVREDLGYACPDALMPGPRYEEVGADDDHGGLGQREQ